MCVSGKLNFKTGNVGLKMFITYFIKNFYMRIMRSVAKQENPQKLGIFEKPKTHTLLYARLKNGTYSVTGSGIRPSVCP